MFETAVSNKHALPVSLMAENLIGSEIIKLAAEINEKIKNGERIFNYTIGDFDPNIFPIPQELTEKLKTLCRQEACTLFMALLAVLQIVLRRFSSQDDVFLSVAHRRIPPRGTT